MSAARRDAVRYVLSGVAALVSLLVALFLMSKAVGPGSPAEVLLIGELELWQQQLAPEERFEPPPEPERVAPERPRFDR
ncbi:MAG: hypothetical protein ACQGVC_25730 [Myxococcota bacterium]